MKLVYFLEQKVRELFLEGGIGFICVIPSCSTWLCRRLYAAFGNSTRDRQMLEYTNAGDGPRLVMR